MGIKMTDEIGLSLFNEPSSSIFSNNLYRLLFCWNYRCVLIWIFDFHFHLSGQSSVKSKQKVATRYILFKITKPFAMYVYIKFSHIVYNFPSVSINFLPINFWIINIFCLSIFSCLSMFIAHQFFSRIIVSSPSFSFPFFIISFSQWNYSFLYSLIH